MTTRSDKYKLIGKIAIPCSDLEWARWFETAERRVARTEVGPMTVSTVFLGLDHNWLDRGDPLLFETMIFGEREDGESSESHCERVSTWAEAEEAHARAVALAENHLASACIGI